MIVRGSCLALVAALMIGCTLAGSQVGDPRAQPSLIIIKFDDEARAPRALQVCIGNRRTITLAHERPMSGGAHVYKGLMTKRQVAAVLARLRQRAGIAYAEADRRMSY